MIQFGSASELVLLAGMAGAVHVLAPDHWMPCSIATWQRGWGVRKVAVFQSAAVFLHLFLALFIYFSLDWVWPHVDSHRLFEFSVVLVLGALMLRVLRFTRMNEVFRRNSSGASIFLQMLALMGPAESLLPVLIKANQLHAGYLASFSAYALGTLVVGVGAAVGGRLLWNRPLLLPRSMEFLTQRTSLLPVLICVAAGLGYLLKLS